MDYINIPEPLLQSLYLHLTFLPCWAEVKTWPALLSRELSCTCYGAFPPASHPVCCFERSKKCLQTGNARMRLTGCVRPIASAMLPYLALRLFAPVLLILSTHYVCYTRTIKFDNNDDIWSKILKQKSSTGNFLCSNGFLLSNSAGNSGL